MRTITQEPASKKISKSATAGHARKPHLKGADRGVVQYLLGNAHQRDVEHFSLSKLIERMQAGFPVQELDELRSRLDLPMESLMDAMGMSKATFHRRKAEGRLSCSESDRVVRLARLLGKAVEVMESEIAARQWLTSSQFGLGGAVPLEFAKTELGAREVEDLLGRIEYGVYS